jgi:hypothetical protein
MNVRYTVRKLNRGLYEHRSGALIVRTKGWEGPKGGEHSRWDHARWEDGELIVDGVANFRTLSAAIQALDHRDRETA